TAVVDYEFTQTTGASVPDAGGSEAAVVQNAEDGQWTGTSLELTGGEPEDGNWVRLPEDLLAEADSATITTEVKIDESMKQDYNFLWNIGAEDDTDEYFFTSVQDAPRTASPPAPTTRRTAHRPIRTCRPTAGTP